MKRTPFTDKEECQYNFIEKEFVMCKNNIGESRQKVQEKLGTNLAGPFEKYIPQSWVQDILKEIGVRFRQAVFSPLGDDMGVHRAGPGPRSIL